MIEVKVKVTKRTYKAFDSYQRYQKWIGRQILKSIKEVYERKT